jgi:hypothetical protein
MTGVNASTGCFRHHARVIDRFGNITFGDSAAISTFESASTAAQKSINC